MADTNPEDGWPELREGRVRTVLILGGTGEARRLAERLVERPWLKVISSLAGRTGTPRRPPGRVRVGGFGGADGLAAYLRDVGIDLVVDATHPYASTISANALTACDRTGVPLRLLSRSVWTPGPGDRWILADDYADAARKIPEACRRPFLTVGRQNLEPFAARRGLTYVVRVIDPPDRPLPLPDHELVTGRGPFTETSERALMTAHRVDCLVTKNSGGDATAAKLAAARSLALPVVMIAPPGSR
jgi:precorrin-6A/cobalt-precorrin-6A reductase